LSDCAPTCAEIAKRLGEVKAAIHNLLIGKGTQSVTYGDQQVTYTKADLSAMRAYADDLARESDRQCGTCYGRERRRVIQAVPR
jgi:hypothetical protein